MKKPIKTKLEEFLSTFIFEINNKDTKGKIKDGVNKILTNELFPFDKINVESDYMNNSIEVSIIDNKNNKTTKILLG